MTVTKGGVTREIDERRLHEYKAKGYVPAGVEDDPKKPPGKPLKNTSKG